MSTICDRVGFEDIMQGFDFYMEGSTPSKPLYYSIWNGNKLKFISKETDPDSARNEFEQIIKVWQRNGTGGMLEARFHTARPNSQLTNKADYDGSMTFKLTDYNMQPVPQQHGAPAVVNPMASFLEQYQAFLQMQALLAPAAAVGSEEKDIWERIEGLLSTPIVEDVIAGVSEKLGLNMSHYKRDQTMAGDNDAMEADAVDAVTESDEQRMRVALDRLLRVDPEFVNTLERLADMATRNPGKYKMAKGFL